MNQNTKDMFKSLAVVLFLGTPFWIGVGYVATFAMNREPDDLDCRIESDNDERSETCHQVCRENTYWLWFGHKNWCHWDDNRTVTS